MVANLVATVATKIQRVPEGAGKGKASGSLSVVLKGSFVQGGDLD